MAEKGTEKEVLNIEGVQLAFAAFRKSNEAAVTLSERNLGLIHTGRQRRSLMVFTKLICHNASIEKLFLDFADEPLAERFVDHFSIATLARASVDAALMTMYLSEPSLNTTQWDFRRQWIFLHDANNRSRFLKPLKTKGNVAPFFETSDSVKDGIKAKIRELGAHLLLTENAIDDMLKMPPLFVNGARGAVREAGWDVDTFDFMQSYLSAYVHSHPVSFLRAYEHDLKFGGISQFQADFLNMIFSQLSGTTDDVVARMDVFSVPEIGDPNGHVE